MLSVLVSMQCRPVTDTACHPVMFDQMTSRVAPDCTRTLVERSASSGKTNFLQTMTSRAHFVFAEKTLCQLGNRVDQPRSIPQCVVSSLAKWLKRLF